MAYIIALKDCVAHKGEHWYIIIFRAALKYVLIVSGDFHKNLKLCVVHMLKNLSNINIW